MILNIILRFFTFMLILGILIFPQNVTEACRNGVEICIFKVVPSLFPFFVVQALALKVGLLDIFAKCLAPLKLFKMPNISPFILGIIGGYPVGAKSVYDLYNAKEISKKSAENALGFCNNAGPAFVVGFIGVGLLNSLEYGYLILISHILSAIIVGIIFSFTVKDNTYYNIKIRSENYFLKELINSVKDSFLAIIYVCSFIIFASALVEILHSFRVFSSLSYLISLIIPINQDAIISVLIGSIEMTTGLNFLSSLSLSIKTKLALASCMLSFAGLSIHMQVMMLTGDLRLRKYFLGKILASIFSPIICLLIYQYILMG